MGRTPIDYTLMPRGPWMIPDGERTLEPTPVAIAIACKWLREVRPREPVYTGVVQFAVQVLSETEFFHFSRCSRDGDITRQGLGETMETLVLRAKSKSRRKPR